MKTTSTLLAALLLAFASAAYADTTSNSQAPTQPTTGQGADTTVSTSPASDKSNGHADQGLSTAEQNITAPHGVDRPSMPSRPSIPSRPSLPDRPSR